METLLWLLAIFLFLNIIVGMLRVLVGPTPEDRLAAAMLFGTTGVALLLVLAHVTEQPSIRDVALVLVVLAAVVIVVFGEARRAERSAGGPVDGGSGDGPA
jgi:multicomponent Na+:H+ antiporter subunit F